MKSRHRVAVSSAAVVLLAASYFIGQWWLDSSQQQPAALRQTGKFEDAAREFESSRTARECWSSTARRSLGRA